MRSNHSLDRPGPRLVGGLAASVGALPVMLASACVGGKCSRNCLDPQLWRGSRFGATDGGHLRLRVAGMRRGRDGTAVRGGWMVVAALLGLLAFGSVALASHAGELDHSFGHEGFVFKRHGNSEDVAIGKKDKPVVGGRRNHGFAAIRYTQHGQVDSSFGGDDGVQTRFGNSPSEFPDAVAVGSDGAAVVAGEVCHRNIGCNFAVAKWQSDGQLDQGFGDDGHVELGPGEVSPAAEDLLVGSVAFTGQGKILVAGSACTAGACGFALAQLLPNGDPDPEFGPNGDGTVVTSFQRKNGDQLDAQAMAMAIDSRGRIAVGGQNRSNPAAPVALYDPHGHLVPSFGQDGKLITNHLRHLGSIAGLATDAKDKIVAVGDDKKKLFHRWALARFGKDGRVDHSFGNDGSVVTGFPGKQLVEARGLAIDSKNRIVVSGTSHFSVVRYRPNGNLNKSFGHNGRVTKKKHADGGAVAIDSRNRPVVVGKRPNWFVVARLLG